MDQNQPAKLEANEKNIDDLSAKNEFNGVQITHNEEKEILVDLKKELPNQSALPLRGVTVDKGYGFPNAFSYQFESAVTILTGKNGVGKSQFLNAIAKHEEPEVAVQLANKPYEIIQLDCQMNLLNSGQVGKQLSRWDLAQESMAERIHYCAVLPKEETWAAKFPDENQRGQAKKILEVVLEHLTVGDIQNQILRVCKRMYCQARLDPHCIILNAKDFHRNDFKNRLSEFSFDEESIQIVINQIGPGKSWDFRLSAGQKVQVFTAAILCTEAFNAQPVFLLDELTSHLHLESVEQFVRIIRDCFVEKLKGQVILVTHSPSVVELCHDEMTTIALMRRINGIVSLETVNKVTACMDISTRCLFISLSVRNVFCEAPDDVTFFRLLYSQISALPDFKLARQLYFLSIGSNREGDYTNSSRGMVKKIVASIMEGISKDSDLHNTIGGLIDNDNQPETPRNIFQLERYSIENYVLDPINMFHLWKKKDCLFTNAFGILFEQTISPTYQDIIDIICNYLAEQHATGCNNSDECGICNNTAKSYNDTVDGFEIIYPMWFKSMRGHDLMDLYSKKLTKKVKMHQFLKLMDKFEIQFAISRDIKTTFSKMGT